MYSYDSNPNGRFVRVVFHVSERSGRRKPPAERKRLVPATVVQVPRAALSENVKERLFIHTTHTQTVLTFPDRGAGNFARSSFV